MDDPSISIYVSIYSYLKEIKREKCSCGLSKHSRFSPKDPGLDLLESRAWGTRLTPTLREGRSSAVRVRTIGAPQAREDGSSCVPVLAMTSKPIAKAFSHNFAAHGNFSGRFARGGYQEAVQRGTHGRKICQICSLLTPVSLRSGFILQRPNTQLTTWGLLKKPDPQSHGVAFHAQGSLEAGWRKGRKGGSRGTHGGAHTHKRKQNLIYADQFRQSIGWDVTYAI